MRIQGCVAVVTGASSGIGAATARELARRGARVVLAARRQARLEALAAEIQAAGGEALVVVADLSRRQDADRLVQATVNRFGRVDLLVNNAGTGLGSMVLASTDDAMHHLVSLNLLAIARLTQAALPYLARSERGGPVIVNVGSIAGEGAGLGLYAATKAGVKALSDALRWEVAHLGIQVVLVEPGFIRTEMTEGLRVPIPLPVPGPEVVARAIVRAAERPHRARTVIVPGWYLPLLWLMRLAPRPLVDRFAARVARRRERERARLGQVSRPPSAP